MWMCFAFDLEDDAITLFWIKILQDGWPPLGSEKRVCLKEMSVF